MKEVFCTLKNRSVMIGKTGISSGAVEDTYDITIHGRYECSENNWLCNNVEVNRCALLKEIERENRCR